MESYSYYDEKYVPKPIGFINNGAICWFNSLLQVLLGIPALTRYMLDYENEFVKNSFAMDYIRLLKRTLAGPSDPSIAAASSNLLRSMIDYAKKKNIKINLGMGQECANEGICTFITLLGNQYVERLFTNIYSLTIECTSCKRISCTDRTNSMQIEMFTDAPLDTKEQFCEYLRIHYSETDRYWCSCGHVMMNFNRVERLKMLREVIVIVFNKFATKKNRWFPTDLTFPSTGGSKIHYELVGKVNHNGTTKSGHYWAHSRRPGDWYQLNDSQSTSGSAVPEPQTFMVVYHIVK